ncbi:MAG: indolepyruvate oxidoreductase [Bacteroidetes bacterium HGW-Bacteroidetes-17]|jgi:indolepyruvate ferredoxin oxidoreductase beta subunit|nr:MAG: indolepyruvate oxidoreductase [Bacteroidetes bacterium HGW-Bacteroidetes-17]
MKKDIILAGVGGQGILSIAATIGTAAIDLDLQLKQAEVHGMSQRGGDVQSHLRLSSNPIASDLIPQGKADLIISIEPMESLRYLPMLSKDGWIIANTQPFINIPNYPDLEQIIEKIKSIPNHIAINADEIAKEIGSERSANMVILGASAPFLDIEIGSLEKAIQTIFGSKGEDVVALNLKAFRAGLNFSLSNK